MAVFTLGDAREAQSEGASGGPQEVDVDELVTVRESICLRPFQTKIIEGWVRPLFGDMAHVMITPLKAGEGQPWEARPLLPGLHILYAYVMRRRGRLAPRQPLSVCALLPTYEGNRHLQPLGNLGHRLRRPRWID